MDLPVFCVFEHVTDCYKSSLIVLEQNLSFMIIPLNGSFMAFTNIACGILRGNVRSMIQTPKPCSHLTSAFAFAPNF